MTSCWQTRGGAGNETEKNLVQNEGERCTADLYRRDYRDILTEVWSGG